MPNFHPRIILNGGVQLYLNVCYEIQDVGCSIVYEEGRVNLVDMLLVNYYYNNN